MDEQTTPALILDRVLFGDRDLVLTLLTRDHGIVSAIARSARGSRHRFAGSLDLFVVFQAGLRARPHGALSVLTQAEPLHHLAGILESLDRLEIGQAMLVLARDLLRDAPAGPVTFEHVTTAFEALERCAPGAEHAPLLALCLALLGDLHHPPSTTVCSLCGTAYGAEGAMLRPDGAIACPSCVRPGFGSVAIASDLLALCRGVEPSTPANRAAVLGLIVALVSAVLGRSYRLGL